MFTLCLLAAFAAAPSILVSPEALAASPEAWQLVDARTAEAYAAGFIPGARHLDPETLSEERNGVNGLLKPLDALTSLLAEAGLDPAKPVLIYSAMAQTSDLKRATRLFWILEYLSYPQVAVLDGGFARWVAEDRPVSTEPVAVPALDPNALDLRPRPELLATHEEVVQMIEKKDGVLVDNRSTEQYIGVAQSGATAKAGHIDGARSLPVEHLLDSDTLTFKQGTALDEATAEVPQDAKMPVVTYCNTGRDASAGYFGLRLRGVENVALYDGSMAEWSRLPQLAVQE